MAAIHNRFSKIAPAFKERNVVVFCGAGVSLFPPANGPSGIELRNLYLANLMRWPSLCHGVRLLNRCGALRPERLISAFHQVLSNQVITPLSLLGSGLPNAVHKAIIELYNRGYIDSIITTNFDNLFEICFASSNSRVNTGTLRLLKIHGSSERLETCRIRIEQVLRPLSRKVVRSIFNITHDKTVIFLGYSGYDNDIWPVLARIPARRLIWAIAPWIEKMKRGYNPMQEILKHQQGETIPLDLRLFPHWANREYHLNIDSDLLHSCCQHRKQVQWTRIGRAVKQCMHSLQYDEAALILGTLLHECHLTEASANVLALARQHSQTRSTWLMATWKLAAVRSQMKRLSLALNLYKSATIRMRTEQASAPLANLLCGYAELQRKREKPHHAVDLARRSRRLAARLNDHELKGRAYLAEANALADLRPQVTSVRVLYGYANAIAEFRKSADPRRLGDVYKDRGSLFYEMGKFNAALRDQQRAIRFYESVGDADGESRALDNVVMCRIDMGRIDEALAQLDRNIEQYRRVHNFLSLGISFYHRGLIHLLRGRFRSCLEDTNLAIRNSASRRLIVHALIQKLGAYIGMRDYSRAGHLGTQLLKRQMMPHYRAHLWVYMGRLHFLCNRPWIAMRFIDKARNVFQSIGDNMGLIECNEVIESGGLSAFH